MKYTRDWLVEELEERTRMAYEAEGVEGDSDDAVLYWRYDCTTQELRGELALRLWRGRYARNSKPSKPR